MTFPPLEPTPEIPPPPREEPQDLPRRDDDPFQFPPDTEVPIEPQDPDDEPEDKALPPQVYHAHGAAGPDGACGPLA